jgi:hypothetical protein
VDRDGKILVANFTGQPTILIYDEDGTHQHTITDGRISIAEGLTLTPRDELVVVDYNTKSLFVFK